jgi:CheY-like chemotaxis protein
LRVAIVEDSPDLAFTLSKVLSKFGYPSPAVFHDGTSIVRALTRDRESFDVILMDYRMPEMNGIEAAKIIQRYRKDTKIILASAYAFVKDKASEAGLPFLQKPFSSAQLVDCLDSLAGHPSTNL